MQVYYDPWLFNPNTGYYFRTCHYQFNPNGPWYYFYVVCYPNHPYYRNFFYCYYPLLGCYWCRCYSPWSPDFDPNLFSVLPPANRYPTVAQCEPYFPPFVSTPAHYPPDFQTPMGQLPSDLPPG